MNQPVETRICSLVWLISPVVILTLCTNFRLYASGTSPSSTAHLVSLAPICEFILFGADLVCWQPWKRNCRVLLEWDSPRKQWITHEVSLEIRNWKQPQAVLSHPSKLTCTFAKLFYHLFQTVMASSFIISTSFSPGSWPCWNTHSLFLRFFPATLWLRVVLDSHSSVWWDLVVLRTFFETGESWMQWAYHSRALWYLPPEG